MDFIGPLPKTQKGNNYILTFIDTFTNLLTAVPLKSDEAESITARTTAEHFVREVIRHRGLPDIIMSDRDSRFLSTFWQEVHSALRTKLKMTTSYNPRADPAERANRIILEALRTVVGAHYDRWDEFLPLVEFGLNSAVSSRTGMSPFQLTYGWTPKPPAAVAANHTFANPGAEQFVQDAQQRFQAAQDAIAMAQLKLVELMSRRRAPVNLAVGDYVWLSSRNVSLATPAKFTPPWLGPYQVLEVRGNHARLDLPPTLGKRFDVVNFDRLRRFHQRDPRLGSTNLNPPPAFSRDGAEFFVVEKILNHRTRPNGPREFLVRWQGYDDSWDSWEPEPQLRADVPLLVEQYLAQPSTVRLRKAPIRASSRLRKTS